MSIEPNISPVVARSRRFNRRRLRLMVTGLAAILTAATLGALILERWRDAGDRST
jgi:hypothetical protein